MRVDCFSIVIKRSHHSAMDTTSITTRSSRSAYRAPIMSPRHRVLTALLLLTTLHVVTPVTSTELANASRVAPTHMTTQQQPKRVQYLTFAGPFDLHKGQIAHSLHMMQGVPNRDLSATLPELFAIYSVSVELVTLDDSDSGRERTPRVVTHSDALLRRHVLSRPLERVRAPAMAGPSAAQALLLDSPALLASQQSILIAGGAEAQGDHAYIFPYPYAFAATGAVSTDVSDALALQDQWLVDAHVVNTQNMSSATRARCSDCPCTLEDRKANAMINGEAVVPDRCSAQLTKTHNTACAFETYLGGLHCCVDGEFCLERDALAKHAEVNGTAAQSANASSAGVPPTPAAAPISSFYLQYSIEYAAADDANRWLYVATCCDASGDLNTPGNVEYDVPACAASTDNNDTAACVHNLTTYQRVDSGDLGNPVWDAKRAKIAPVRPSLKTMSGNASAPSPSTSASATKPPLHVNPTLDPDREVDLVFAVAHQHSGALGIRLYRHATGELLCASLPTYADDDTTSESSGAANDHSRRRRLVGMTPCVFEPAQRLRASDVLRIEALYDNSEARIGAQSLMYLAIHDVEHRTSEEQQQRPSMLHNNAAPSDDAESTITSAGADVVSDLHQLLVLLGAVASVLATLALVAAALKRRRRALGGGTYAPPLGVSTKLDVTGRGRYTVAETSIDLPASPPLV